MDNTDIGLPSPVPSFVVWSNPILAIGFNSFTWVFDATLDTELYVAVCHPTNLGLLTSLLIGVFAPPGPTGFDFGAFELTMGADPFVWNVLRLGVVNVVPPGVSTITTCQLFAGRR